MRPDLAALTPESAAALSSRGLVRRAVREIAEGAGPAVAEAPDGTVRATFAAGTVAELPPGRPLREGACTCGAPTVCRHLVAAALAYAAGAVAAPAGEPAPDDVELAAFVGAPALRRARAAWAAGADAEVVRGRELVVRLPAATVRFLSPALALARCDCAASPRCEHVALAVFALRGAAGGSGRVSGSGGGAALDEATRRVVADVEALARDLLAHGAAGVSAGLLARLRVTRDRVEAAGLTWLATLVDDLEEVLGDYQARSARYAPDRFAGHLAETMARVRAASAGGALDARVVLGLGERRETTLATLRVVALGARASAEGTAREVVVFLADPVTGLVLAHRRRWRGAEEALGDAADVAERTVVTGLRVRELALAEAQLRDLRRSATGHVRWTVFRRGLAAALPLGGPDAAPGRAEEAWRGLPEPLRVPDVAAWWGLRRRGVPALLSPRLATAGVHVLEIASLDGLSYAPGRQALVARVRDTAGHAVRLVREHRSVAPRALEVLARVLPEARLVSGELRAVNGGFEMEVIGVVADTLVVPDLERAAPPLALPLDTAPPAPDPLVAALRAAASVIDDAAHLGLETLPRSWHVRAQAAAGALREAGFRRLAPLVEALAATPSPEPWTEAAVMTVLTRERLAGA